MGAGDEGHSVPNLWETSYLDAPREIQDRVRAAALRIGAHAFSPQMVDNARLGDPTPDYVPESPGKLSDEDVREVRRRAFAGELYSSIADRFGITKKTASAIANLKSRGNVR